MASTLDALVLLARDPEALADFWGGLLGWRGREVDDEGRVTVRGEDPAGLALRLEPSMAERTLPNPMHLDLTSTSLEDQEARVERALALGGRHHDVGQTGEEGHVVLADPEGNELCVIEPGNRFLAGCGPVGAVAGDGSQACGYFWAAALGWPLVWDQDEETAIQSPGGGTKLTWGGPPLGPAGPADRVRYDLRLVPGEDGEAEVRRLVGLGASPRDGGAASGRRVLADPDGHPLHLLLPR
ncbi:VOC family protein [Nocardioides nanhaiensis]|uniref:VOC family protein n=1 Tax=Nocardioides nanhaiensis TaxID=1476871 RepID=A0ABP8X2A9_9ACTN